MSLMAKHQFEVVKLMQKGDATPKSFARHTGEPVDKMIPAFNAPNYESYQLAASKATRVDEMMERFFGGNNPYGGK
jgi:hypothetical protein